MGMASGDDERKIHEDHERREWLKQAPRRRSYDSPPPTEDEAAHERHEIEKWLEDMPPVRDPYENDRR